MTTFCRSDAWDATIYDFSLFVRDPATKQTHDNYHHDQSNMIATYDENIIRSQYLRSTVPYYWANPNFQRPTANQASYHFLRQESYGISLSRNSLMQVKLQY